MLKIVITGGEIWVYRYNVETKSRSSQRIYSGWPRPKKTRMSRLYLLRSLIVHHEYLPNIQWRVLYLQISMPFAWSYYKDNTETMPQPPYSPDMATYDFSISKNKRNLNHANIEDILFFEKNQFFTKFFKILFQILY